MLKHRKLSKLLVLHKNQFIFKNNSNFFNENCNVDNISNGNYNNNVNDIGNKISNNNDNYNNNKNCNGN